MALLDKQLQLSAAQALTVSVRSTNVINLIAANAQIGAGEPLAILMKVDVAADATTGDETYQFEIHGDDNAAFTSAAIIYSQAISRTLLTINSRWVFLIPPTSSIEQYLSLYYTLGGTTPTITCTAYLDSLANVRAWMAYASGYSVL